MKLNYFHCLAIGCLLVLGGCSSNDDDGETDVGMTDEGMTDEGMTDEGMTDEGMTDEGMTDEGMTEPELVSSCEMVDITALQASGGVFSTVLPADLSAPGSLIALSSPAIEQLNAFDSATGSVEFSTQGSRLSRIAEYDVTDAQGEVLSRHEHRWIFSPVRIMPLGDSITAGVEFFDGTNDLPPMDLRVGYRKFLFDKLAASGIAIDYLGQGGQVAGAATGLADPENNGYPGVDIDFINGKLIELLTEDTVDVILLHIGTNNTPDNAQGIDDWLDTLDEWEANNQPVLAMVASIVPKRDPNLNATVEQFNQDLINRIAARTDDLVVLVDQNTAVSVADLSEEAIGLHPSPVGYEKMADAWFEALTAVPSDALHSCP